MGVEIFLTFKFLKMVVPASVLGMNAPQWQYFLFQVKSLSYLVQLCKQLDFGIVGCLAMQNFG